MEQHAVSHGRRQPRRTHAAAGRTDVAPCKARHRYTIHHQDALTGVGLCRRGRRLLLGVRLLLSQLPRHKGLDLLLHGACSTGNTTIATVDVKFEPVCSASCRAVKALTCSSTVPAVSRSNVVVYEKREARHTDRDLLPSSACTTADEPRPLDAPSWSLPSRAGHGVPGCTWHTAAQHATRSSHPMRSPNAVTHPS